jgi:hypothetical protein
MRTKIALLAAAAIGFIVAACGQVAAPTNATAQQQDIYIHVDPATGCHYIVFPSGTGTVRVKPDGLPYCETAAAAPAP